VIAFLFRDWQDLTLFCFAAYAFVVTVVLVVVRAAERRERVRR
jgi:hypothetical protein